jgi:hypothetical protein
MKGFTYNRIFSNKNKNKNTFSFNNYNYIRESYNIGRTHIILNIKHAYIQLNVFKKLCSSII